MNLTEILGHPIDDLLDIDHSSTQPCGQRPDPPSPVGAEPRRTSRYGTALAVAAALIAGVAIGAFLPWTSPALPEAAPISPGLPPPEVGSVAELFTSLYLTGMGVESDLADLYLGDVVPAGPTGIWVDKSAALGTDDLGNGFWEVVVAVNVLELVNGAYEAAGIQYYAVTIAAGTDQPIAVSAPARISGPRPIAAPADLPTFTHPVGADQASAVTGFLQSHLTGSGEVARFVSPTAQIHSFADAPYAAITITSMDADAQGRVRAQAQGTTHRGNSQHLEYVVELVFADGIWEVAGIN